MNNIDDIDTIINEPKETISIEEFTKLLADAKRNKNSMSVIVNGKEIKISGLEDDDDITFAVLPFINNDKRKMKVTHVEEDEYIEFDNGVKISSYHNQDCCEWNYLDFSQFRVGMEFPAIKEPEDIQKVIHLRKDGIYLVSEDGLPIWAQARSAQNGYYSDRVGVEVVVKTPFHLHIGDNNEPLEGEEYE